MGFSRQESWRGLPFPSPGDLPNPGIEPVSFALLADYLPKEPLGKPRILSAAAAAKSLQSCPTLCNSIDGSPPSSPVPGILQARTLECQCMKEKSGREVTQLCPTLRDPIDCSLPGSSVHGTFQARVLEWGATAFSKKSYSMFLSPYSSHLVISTIHSHGFLCEVPDYHI